MPNGGFNPKSWDEFKDLGNSVQLYEIYRSLSEFNQRIDCLENHKQDLDKTHRKYAFLGGIVGGAGSLSIIGSIFILFNYLIV